MNIRKGLCEDQCGKVGFEFEFMYNKIHGFRSLEGRRVFGEIKTVCRNVDYLL